MVTLLLAWMDGVYKQGFILLYLGTVLIDVTLIEALGNVWLN